LDSYRNVISGENIFGKRWDKSFEYIINPEKIGNWVKVNKWDNPHNLVISLLFEFGLFGLVFLIGYLRQLSIWFRRAVKEPNTIALAGFLIGVLIISMGHFPLFLARIVVFVIPCAALLEINLK